MLKMTDWPAVIPPGHCCPCRCRTGKRCHTVASAGTSCRVQHVCISHSCRPGSIVLLSSSGSHVAASIQSSAGWLGSVLCQTYKVVMEVQDEMLGEMVPVSPRPFTALQAAMAGSCVPGLVDEQYTTWLCSSLPNRLTGVRGQGVLLRKQQARACLHNSQECGEPLASSKPPAAVAARQRHCVQSVGMQSVGWHMLQCIAVVAADGSSEPPRGRFKAKGRPAVSAASAICVLKLLQ